MICCTQENSVVKIIRDIFTDGADRQAPENLSVGLSQTGDRATVLFVTVGQ